MVATILISLLLIAGAAQGRSQGEMTVESAKIRIYRDLVKSLHNAIGDLQVNNVYNMLRMYTHSTHEQTHQVIEYIEKHTNQSRSDSQTLRMAVNASVEITDCIQRGEMNLLQAFRNTGYNVQNCIRSAQMGYEKSYVELNAKLDALKGKALGAYRHYAAILDNCVDSECVMKTLIQSVVKYETLREELSQEEMAGNNLNVRYLVTSIAMGCVSSSLQQIHDNYGVGKELMARCFHVNKAQNQNQTPRQGENQNNQQAG